MPNKPKMDFMLNVPTVIVLGDNFKNGTGQYGPWYGWGVTEGGVEKTLFADSDLQVKISPFGKGTALSITKSQVPGTRQFAWKVQPVGQTAPAPPAYAAPPPQVTSNGHVNRDAYRHERIARAEEAMEDAMKVLQVPTVDENVRALAISFLIDEQRKDISAPADDPF